MDSIGEIIKEKIKKHPKDIFIPTGEVSYRLPTGSLGLDRVLGGGIPSGKIVQIFGREGSGKTTTVYHIIAEAQKADLPLVFFDIEGAYDEQYAKAIGIDTENLNRINVSTISDDLDLFELTKEFLVEGNAKIIVVDSITAIETNDAVGAHARFISSGMKKILFPIAKNDAIAVIVNQYRMKISTNPRYPSTPQAAGGLGLQHYTDIKIAMEQDNPATKERRKKPEFIEDTVVNAVVQKAKDYNVRPQGMASFLITHGKGINHISEIANIAKDLGILEQAGAYYKCNNKTVAQGYQGLLEKLEQDEEFR